MAGFRSPGGALGWGSKVPGSGACNAGDLLRLRDLHGGVVVRLLLLRGEKHHHGDGHALQTQVVSTAAVGLEADLAQQVCLNHKRIRNTKVFQYCPWLRQEGYSVRLACTLRAHARQTFKADTCKKKKQDEFSQRLLWRNLAANCISFVAG